MLIKAKGVDLIMWEKSEMPERAYNKVTKEWTATGKTEEKTLYTFRDEMGDKVIFLSGNDWRGLERSKVDLEMEIVYNDFDRKNKVSLKGVFPTK